jgi:hypothetical protein
MVVTSSRVILLNQTKSVLHIRSSQKLTSHKNSMKRKLLLTAGLLGLASASNAAVIGVYNFETNTFGPLASETAANISLGNLSMEVNPGDLSYSSGSSLAEWDDATVTPVVNDSPSGPAGRLFVDNGSFTLGPSATYTVGTLEFGNYISFTLTVDAGFQLDLNSVTADLGTRNNGASHMAITYVSGASEVNLTTGGEIDVAVTDPQSALGTGNFDWDRYTFSENIAGTETLTGSVEFRIYARGNGSTANSHNTYIDNIVLDGAISAVPEPSAYALIAGMLGLGWVVALRRRR